MDHTDIVEVVPGNSGLMAFGVEESLAPLVGLWVEIRTALVRYIGKGTPDSSDQRVSVLEENLPMVVSVEVHTVLEGEVAEG